MAAEKELKALSPAAQARVNAGLTIEQAAKRAFISPGYLKQLERPSTGAGFGLACRLAGMYTKLGVPCSIAVFGPAYRPQGIAKKKSKGS